MAICRRAVAIMIFFTGLLTRTDDIVSFAVNDIHNTSKFRFEFEVEESLNGSARDWVDDKTGKGPLRDGNKVMETKHFKTIARTKHLSKVLSKAVTQKQRFMKQSEPINENFSEVNELSNISEIISTISDMVFEIFTAASNNISERTPEPSMEIIKAFIGTPETAMLSSIKQSTDGITSPIPISMKSTISSFTKKPIETREVPNMNEIRKTSPTGIVDDVDKSEFISIDRKKITRKPSNDESSTISKWISGIEPSGSSKKEVDYEHFDSSPPLDVLTSTVGNNHVEPIRSESHNVHPRKSEMAAKAVIFEDTRGIVGGIVGGAFVFLIAIFITIIVVFKVKKKQRKSTEGLDTPRSDPPVILDANESNNEWAPEKIAASQFNFKGPLMIPFKQPLIMEHELEKEKPPSQHDDMHVQFDDNLNEVYEIGSEIEVVVLDDNRAKLKTKSNRPVRRPNHDSREKHAQITLRD